MCRSPSRAPDPKAPRRAGAVYGAAVVAVAPATVVDDVGETTGPTGAIVVVGPDDVVVVGSTVLVVAALTLTPQADLV